MQNLISPWVTSVCKKKVGPHNFLKKRIVKRKQTVPELHDASEPIEKNGHLTCFAEHAEHESMRHEREYS
jgi:hypothetical protein